MNKYKSKNPMKMQQYNVMLDHARDKNSTFYNGDGSQNVAASHRSIFWKGFNGTFAKHPNLIPHNSSISYCSYRAGVDFKKETLAGQD